MSAYYRGVWLSLALSAVLRARVPNPVEVTVVAVAGQSLYLDRGSDAGIAGGNPVRLFPVGAHRPVSSRRTGPWQAAQDLASGR
jgi:hypothetical protein